MESENKNLRWGFKNIGPNFTAGFKMLWNLIQNSELRKRI